MSGVGQTIAFCRLPIRYGFGRLAKSRSFSQTELHCTAVIERMPRIEIEYCTECRWLLRAAWMAQELLTTFSTEIAELALVPGSGGVFEIRIGGETVWSRAKNGRFPEMKELKQLVRDRIAPTKDLGHSDR